MIINVGNYISNIEFTENDSLKKHIVKRLRDKTSIDDPKRFMSPAFKRHYWDGKIHFYNDEDNTFKTGIIDEITEGIKELQGTYPNLQISFNDMRGKEIKATVDDDISLMDGDKDDIHLRDYQVGSIKSAIDKQKGIILLSTGAGKTEVASGIIKYTLPQLSQYERAIFMVHSKDIAYQAQKRIEKRLGIKVGFWGDGQKDIQKVTVCMVGTLNSALKKPDKDIKLTNNKDKGLKKFVEEFYPKLVGKPNIKLMAKSYLNHYTVKFKYDEDVKDILSALAFADDTSKMDKALEWYKEKYNKLVIKKNKKGFDKYNAAVEFLEEVKVSITDECHHSVSDTYVNVYSNMPNARLNVGLTGTIDKYNPALQKQLKANFGSILYTIRNKEMIDRSFTALPTIKLVPVTEPQAPLLEQFAQKRVMALPPAQRKLMEYQQVYNEGIVNNDYRNDLIMNITKILYQKDDGTILIVVDKVDHGEIISNILTDNNIKNSFIQGSNTTEQRNEMLQGVNEGTLKVLIGTQLVDEGIDLPNLKYLLYVSGGKSQRQLLQRIGRILRRSESKVTATIYDFQDKTHPMLNKQAEQRVRIYKDEQFEIS